MDDMNNMPMEGGDMPEGEKKPMEGEEMPAEGDTPEMPADGEAA